VDPLKRDVYSREPDESAVVSSEVRSRSSWFEEEVRSRSSSFGEKVMTQQPFAGGGPIPSGRPGQMTAVMRAMPQITGPKVLRIGLVQGGKVIEERVIKQRTHVTIGPSEKSMFVVPSQNVPPNFRLFELVANEYQLNFLDGMTGRVALQTGITDLAALRGQAKRSSQGAYQVRLTEDARGKVVVGETTFLFQFVAPPPSSPSRSFRFRSRVARQSDRLDDDDHLGVLVPLPLRHGGRCLFRLDGSGRR